MGARLALSVSVIIGGMIPPNPPAGIGDPISERQPFDYPCRPDLEGSYQPVGVYWPASQENLEYSACVPRCSKSNRLSVQRVPPRARTCVGPWSTLCRFSIRTSAVPSAPRIAVTVVSNCPDGSRRSFAAGHAREILLSSVGTTGC